MYKRTRFFTAMYNNIHHYYHFYVCIKFPLCLYILSLVGLKDSETNKYRPPESNHLQQYHDPFEYDYGDYLEGYQNYAKPQRPKTIPERIARWFTGFKIPARNKVR